MAGNSHMSKNVIEEEDFLHSRRRAFVFCEMENFQQPEAYGDKATTLYPERVPSTKHNRNTHARK